MLIERIGGKIPSSGIHSIERNGTCMEHYYQPEIECASQEQIRAWQGERLAKTVKRVYENVEFYRKKMDEVGVKPEDIHSVEDLHKLPFLTKDDLRRVYQIPQDVRDAGFQANPR